MLPPLFRIETILNACQNGELILTPNQRLRSKALQAWGIHQKSLKHNAWPQPRIFTIEQWLQHCWQRLQSQAYEPSSIMIASAEQERVLWEKITADCGLMRPEILAKIAASGFNTLEKWQLTPNDLISHNTNEGIDLYIQWCLRFKTLLKKQGMISRAHSYHLIGDAFSQNILAQEPIIRLVAFDDIPPLLSCQLNKATTKLANVDLHNYQPQLIGKMHCRDSKTEMTMVAEWAKQLLTESADQQTPVRIGIIVPNLGQCRQLIERALINSFEGHSLLIDTPRYTLPFNISAGTPLGDTPLINDALQLLKLHQPKWPINQLCQLLFSPFWGQLSQETDQRYPLATWLQAQGLFDIRLSELRYQMEKRGIEGDDQKQTLFKRFSTLHEHQLQHKGRQQPSTWVTVFLEQLTLMQWPGERQPDSHEYQQTQLWYQLLERFAGLDSTLGTIYCAEALEQLQRMANHEPFQAQVPDSPIQVLGILEGAGLQFTHCWVLGLHQQSWPPTPAPNPLLPLKLQREHNMPHATNLRELAFAESLTKHYRHCADQIIMSYPQYDPDNEQTLQASLLIDDIPEITDTTLLANRSNVQSDFDRYLLAQRQSQSFERIDCIQGPAVTKQDLNDSGELPGGTGILKAQSTNPFDAFANYRLKAYIPTTAVIGFSPIEKGNILHQSLANIWQQLKTQQVLIDTDIHILDTMVNSAVEQEIRYCQRGKHHHLGDRLCQIEKERQVELIFKWLEFEKSRPSFTVAAIEETCHIQLQGATIKLRIDRVDQLSDGSYLILDYKTGNSTTGDWQGQRPRDPQLPLYLISAHHEPTCGIAFAQINIHKQTLVGLHNGDYPNKTLTPIGDNRHDLPNDWQTAKTHWQKVIETLFQNFLSGHCAVDYRDNLSMNYQQALLPLNRYFDHLRLKPQG